MQFFRQKVRSKRRVKRRGAAMVETAVVMPFLLILLLGMIELGRVMMLNQVTTNACREACRRAVIPGMTKAKVEQICNDYLDDAGVSEEGRVVKMLDSQGNEVDPADVNSHEPVTIQIQLPYKENTWGFTKIVGLKSLSTEVTMRRE